MSYSKQDVEYLDEILAFLTKHNKAIHPNYLPEGLGLTKGLDRSSVRKLQMYFKQITASRVRDGYLDYAGDIGKVIINPKYKDYSSRLDNNDRINKPKNVITRLFNRITTVFHVNRDSPPTKKWQMISAFIATIGILIAIITLILKLLNIL